MPDIRPTTPTIELSVVIATFNRPALISALLDQLAVQTLSPERFEVVVVDDGSAIPLSESLQGRTYPFRLRIIEQENGGPGAARHTGVSLASGSLIVIVDDDMRIAPDFLSAHRDHHIAGSRRVVLGRLYADPEAALELFDRYHLALLDKMAEADRRSPGQLRGGQMYSGNVSFPREAYVAVGGFDPSFRISEDAELGIRFERAGLEFLLSESAIAHHASDHVSFDKWMRRSLDYGAADSQVARKHPALASANPWRFLFMVNPLSRPLLLSSAVMPGVMSFVARGVGRLAGVVAAVRFERLAIALLTLTYGMQYYAGVRRFSGSRPSMWKTLRHYLNMAETGSLGPIGRIAQWWAALRADHEALRAGDARYASSRERRGSMFADSVTRIGFQMMVWYRWMRLMRALHLGVFARLSSRMIRHLYAADIHWDAELAPGVVIVHGSGLIISHAARVASGCILFQHVTLGESMHPVTREVGAPRLEENVHVGAGAKLLGPIVVGAGSKVMANAVLLQDVPAGSVVEVPPVSIRERNVAVPQPAAEGAEGATEVERSDRATLRVLP